MTQSAKADALVVVEAKGVKLQAGQSIDGTQKLKLAEGERVTLISPDGRTIKLRGPYEDAPAPGGAAQSGDVVNSLKTLINERKAGTGTLGVVRSGAGGPDLPDPWIVDVGRSGARCIRAGQATVFWRGNGDKTEDLQIAPADKSWQAKSVWPQGTDRLALPPSIPIRSGQNFTLGLGAQNFAVTFHILPAQLNNEAAQAAWMLEKGCDGQAAALLKTVGG